MNGDRLIIMPERDLHRGEQRELRKREKGGLKPNYVWIIESLWRGELQRFVDFFLFPSFASKMWSEFQNVRRSTRRALQHRKSWAKIVARELCLKSELNHDKSPLYLGLKRGKGDFQSSKEEKRTEEEKQSCSGDVFISYSQIYGRCNTTQEIMSQRSAQ